VVTADFVMLMLMMIMMFKGIDKCRIVYDNLKGFDYNNKS